MLIIQFFILRHSYTLFIPHLHRPLHNENSCNLIIAGEKTSLLCS